MIDALEVGGVRYGRVGTTPSVRRGETFLILGQNLPVVGEVRWGQFEPSRGVALEVVSRSSTRWEVRVPVDLRAPDSRTVHIITLVYGTGEGGYFLGLFGMWLRIPDALL